MKKNFKFIALFLMVFAVLVGCVSCTKTSDQIKVYTRDDKSGTRDGFFTGIGFEDAAKSNDPLVSGYIEVADNGSMINSITNDDKGIGYISLASLEGTSLKGLMYEGVEPTEANVLNGTYTLTRNFNYCLREEYTNETNKQIVEAFVAFMSTVEGQATIKEHGGIVPENNNVKSWSEISKDYPIASKDNSGAVIRIAGSTSVSSIVKALLIEFSSKCGNFQFEQNATGSADAYKRTNGSEKDGANASDIGFASREFKEEEAMSDSIKGTMCIDAIVIVVNQNNTINAITKEQIVSIYNGTYTTWSQIAK
ncbi:MAG: substrate-binding domain-containing protein [Bacilli bacterium]